MGLNIVFMGTPDFAVCSLDSIIKAGHNILAVVVQPDKPKGRGMKLVAPPVKDYALCKGIQVFQPKSIKSEDLYSCIKSLNPDAIVVVAYGKILPKGILEMPRYGCINVHASLLPKYRGAAPIQWPIINGEKITGITTMFMDEGLDTGDMILKKEVEISDEDTYQTLHDRLAVEGGNVLNKTLELLEVGQVPRIKQIGESTYARMLKKEDGEIDWSKSAEEIKNLVRGLNPWPGAYSFLNGNCMMKIWKVEVLKEESSVRPGEIVQADHKAGLVISTGSGVIKVLELQAKCCKRMRVGEYLAGKKLMPGEKFKREENK